MLSPTLLKWQKYHLCHHHHQLLLASIYSHKRLVHTDYCGGPSSDERK